MENKKLTRRDFLKLSAYGAAATALAACATPTTEAPKPAATSAPAATQPPAAPTQPPAPTAVPTKAAVTLDVLAWGEDVPAWPNMIAGYKKVAPNVTVNVTEVADGNNNFYPKLQTTIAAGTPPNVSSFQGWEWQPYADKGLLQNVDDFVAADKMDSLYSPTELGNIASSTARGGKKYLVPLQLAAMLMFYAKKPFDDAGLKYPTDDWTMDQFIETATKLTKQGQWGYQANGGWFRDIGWIRLTGKQEFDNLEDPKKAMFNQKEIVERIQLVASDMYYKLKIAPTPADLSGGANAIETVKTAMKYEGPWWFPNMNSQKLRDAKKNVEFDVVLMPKGADDKRRHRGWAEGLSIMKTNKAADSWNLVKYLAGEEGDWIYCSATGRMPNTVKNITEKWLPFIEKEYGVKNGKAFLEAFKRG